MKRYLSILLSLALVAPVLTGCDNDLDEYPSDAPIPAPSEKFTTDIQFVSRLSDASLGSSDADYSALADYLKGLDDSWLVIFDRADGNNLSKLLTPAFDNNRWTAFAFNRIAGKTSYQGSMLYFNQCLPNGAQGVPTGNGSQVTSINTVLTGIRTDTNNAGETSTAPVSFDVDFLTARFDTADQIAAFGGRNGVLRSFYDAHMPLLMVGTVKNDLVGSLRSAVGSLGINYAIQVSEVAAGPEYTIFLLSEERFWGLHSFEKTTLASGIEAYSIKVMW